MQSRQWKCISWMTTSITWRIKKRYRFWYREYLSHLVRLVFRIPRSALKGKMLKRKVYGVEEVIKNLEKAEQEIIRLFYRGMDLATLATSSHIKKNYNRAKTGKGFTDQTGTLRRSIGSKVVIRLSKHMVVGYVFAGTYYAVYVEFRWGGRYAYLWPGIVDMKKQIWETLVEETKGAFR